MKTIITGAAGRMGKMLINLLNMDPEGTLHGALEIPSCPVLGKDAAENAGIPKADVPIVSTRAELPGDADVMIDFTATAALQDNLDFAVSTNTAIVIGTTGIQPEHLAAIQEASKSVPVIWAPNYSVGIALLVKLSKMAASVLDSGFDVEIIEAHHRMKKDSPSGTARLLLNTMINSYNTNDVIYGREGMVGERPKRQIGVHAIRGGDIVGDHTVLFAGIGERIELTHKASTRETFAFGAIRAAKYIVSAGKGLYTMEDVLGF